MIVTLDFETYYDSDYTLKKMTTEAYIRDPRFQVLCCGVKIDDSPPQWLSADELRQYAPQLALCTVLCHHAQFDGLILSHHFDIKPAHWLDTLSMARYLYGNHHSLSLASLSEWFGLGQKTMDYHAFKGRRLEDLTPSEWTQLGSDCGVDCDLTYRLFGCMAAVFPICEYPIIDTTIRMFTEPRLEGDIPLFEKVRDKEFLSKNERLYALGVGEKDLQSSDKFVALLEAEGVEMEWKEGKNGPIPAIARTDEFMRFLVDSDDDRIAALSQARLEVRSTLSETRAGRLHDMAERGALSVYLLYCGAHTRRFSGGDAANFQNLPRRSDLRRGLKAPPGYLVAAPDQSQGECRIVNWLAGQTDVLERFRRGDDPYIPIASEFYGRTITKADEPERGTGKQLELSCGFGCGWWKFQLTAKRGTYGPPVDISDEQAHRAIELYRASHGAVVGLWQQAQQLLNYLASGAHIDWLIFHIENGRIHHPNGTWLDYSTLKREDNEWRLYGRHGWVKMYGAKLVENVVQWTSRIVTTDAWKRFHDMGYPIVGMSHDDTWLLIPEGDEGAKDRIIAAMTETPSWAAGLPLAADCKIGPTYS